MRILVACCVLVAGVQLSDASTCSLASPSEAVEYWRITNPVSDSVRCDWYHGVPDCHWSGWLWKGPAATSASAGKLPFVLLVPGSGQTKGRSAYCEIVNTLVAKGFVVFMPFMRGVDDISIGGTGHGFKNTGVYISIIATGAGLSPQPAVTVDLSGAVMSWPYSARWETVLDSYASTVKNPIYFQQVLNESSANPYSIESTTSPFRKASTTTVGAQMSVFASIAPDSDTQASCTALGTPQYQCVHNAFVGDHGSVLHWIGTALELMGRHGVK